MSAVTCGREDFTKFEADYSPEVRRRLSVRLQEVGRAGFSATRNAAVQRRFVKF